MKEIKKILQFHKKSKPVKDKTQHEILLERRTIRNKKINKLLNKD